MSPLRLHLLLSVLVVASRVILRVAGLQFSFTLDWMWMADPSDLRDRLLETLYYFHAFPPGMNLLTGVLLKVGGAHAATLGVVLFWSLGLVLVNALFYLGRVAGLSVPIAWTVAAAFSLVPQTIYFEHLYLYETPITALLCLSAVLFHRALRRPSLCGWLAFFAVCAAIAVTRSTFHLVWFVAMIAIGVGLSDRPARRLVVVAACLPAVVLVGLYVKNWVLFGDFAASTFGPSNLTHITVSRLPIDVRNAWIAEGKLSRSAALSPYAGPREFLGLLDTRPRREWPAQLTRLEQTSGAPNYNHWLLLEVQRQRFADALYYLRERPTDYLRMIPEGIKEMFKPSTHWHPQDERRRSPHFQHRQLLRPYEDWYNRIVHSLPIAPVGLYVFLPLVVVWTTWRARMLRSSVRSEDVARGNLLLFCLFQIAFVVGFTNVVTFLEVARYRYQIEPFIWLLTAIAVASLRPRRSAA